MKTELVDGVLTMYPEGHIDAKAAGDFELEAMGALEGVPVTQVVMDTGGLDYISSAGLRVLMKVMKRCQGELSVVNANPEVYEVLEMTGFTDMMDVRRRLREVSIEGMDLVGSGANGSVYRLAKDEMVKTFRAGVTLEEIEAERQASRNAFTLGVPCAISFDTVRVADGYGTVYELLDAATLSERICEHPERLDEYALKAAELLAELHALEVPAGVLGDGSAPYHNKVDANAGNFTGDEVARMHGLYDALPAMSRFVHNDFHPRNIMESAGELMLIDLGESGAANPLFDLLHSCLVFNLMGTGGGQEHPDDEMSFVGVTYGHLRRFWKVMLGAYCGGADRAARMNELLMPFAQLAYLTNSMAHPRLPESMHPVYADKVRAVVLAHEDEMLGSVAEMQGLLPRG